MADVPIVDTAGIADRVLTARDGGRQIALISDLDPGFNLASAYRVAAAVRQSREARGERVVGRKVGFTNTTIWAEYAVGAPIWGYVYDTTLHGLADLGAPFSLGGMTEPRLEPEIALCLARAPEPGMDERALLSCVAWLAPGFEIVQSLFPGWRFTAADTVAAVGLHGALLLGPSVRVAPGSEDDWCETLAAFEVDLVRDGTVADRGRSANVLGGGPLAALRHLVEVLGDDSGSPGLAPGEIVTTGTLTRALPIAPGERWSMALSGLPLADIAVTFA